MLTNNLIVSAAKEYRVLKPLAAVSRLSLPQLSAFSQGGLIMRPNRARMGDALLEMLIHLRCTGKCISNHHTGSIINIEKP